MDRKQLAKIALVCALCCLLLFQVETVGEWLLERFFMRNESYSNMYELAQQFVQSDQLEAPDVRNFNHETLANGNTRLQMQAKDGFEILTVTFNDKQQMVDVSHTITFWGNCIFTGLCMLYSLVIISVMIWTIFREAYSNPAEGGE